MGTGCEYPKSGAACSCRYPPPEPARLGAPPASFCPQVHAPLPVRDGVGPSSIVLPAGPWARLADFLRERFPEVAAEIWLGRAARGELRLLNGETTGPEQPYKAGGTLYYYRELEAEPEIPFQAELIYRDDHLLVADKPHFLPVVPAGRYLQQTLLVRLKRELGLEALVPLHRIDRGTAGLVLFSVNPETRGRYQQLFPTRSVEKIYEAVAPSLPALTLPLRHRSRLVEGEPFFRMREVEGEPNSETLIESQTRLDDGLSRYRLQPLTGRKHQLRVHLAALGAAIVNDSFYPELRPELEDDYRHPLQLLARSVRFVDPLSGEARRFESRRQLDLGLAKPD